jgi:beta-glucanase (GH16 family)
MNSTQVAVGNGQLTLTADYVIGQPPTSSGTAINYLSGTVYAQEPYTVMVGGGYSFSGQFLAPTIKGTWPAFWLTGVDSWPPEIDLAEWKGDGDISFNTCNMNGVWITDNVSYNSSSFQTLTMDVMDLNGADVQTNFYLNGVLQSTQTGKAMVDKPFWLWVLRIWNFHF